MTNSGLSQRAACRRSGITRRTARWEGKQAQKDTHLLVRIRECVVCHPEYGYRQVAGRLNETLARVRRLWTLYGFKCSKPRKTRPKIEPNDNPRPHRAEHPDHVWTYDFMSDRLFEGRPFRMLNILDEFTRECLCMKVDRSLKSLDVIDALHRIMNTTGRKPRYVRSDNGSEFTAGAVKEWIQTNAGQCTFIDPGSPWQNGYIESFNGKVRVELLNRESWKTLLEAQICIEAWRSYYNAKRPHSALGRIPPSTFAAQWRAARSAC